MASLSVSILLSFLSSGSVGMRSLRLEKAELTLWVLSLSLMLAMVLGFSESDEIFQTPASELCQFTCIVSVSVSLRSDVGAMFVTRLPHSDCSDTAGAGVSPLYLSPLVSLVLMSRHSPRPSTPRSVAQEKVAAHN